MYREHYFDIVAVDWLPLYFKVIEVVVRQKKYKRKPQFDKNGILFSGYRVHIDIPNESEWHYTTRLSAN